MDYARLFLKFLTVLNNTFRSFICTCNLTRLFSHYACPSTQHFSPTLSSAVSLPVPWSGMPYSPCLPAELLYTVFKFQCYLSCESFLGILKIRSSILYASSVLSMYLNYSIVLQDSNESVSPKGHMSLMQELHLCQSGASFREQNSLKPV